MVLPVPGGGDEGGRDRADLEIDPPEAEHGRAIYCGVDDSGPVRGGSKRGAVRRPSARVPRRWWEQTGIDWKGGREKVAATE